MDCSEMTVEEVAKSVAPCGLICKLCHEAGKCAGCQSGHNCCARRLSEDGCYQYGCCTQKGIPGCWACDDFCCGKDMFSEHHNIRNRAFVRFAKEYGVTKLAELVLKNQQNGIAYGWNRDYDNLGSEEAVYELLKYGKK